MPGFSAWIQTLRPCPRHALRFAGEFCDPELVDHIAGLQPHGQGFAHRNMNLVGHHGARLRITRFPPELVAGDDEVRFCRPGRVRHAHRPRRQDEEEDDDEQRNRRPDDFDRPVAGDLLRVRLAFPGAEVRDAIEDGPPDEGENQAENDQRHETQVVHRLRLRRLRVEHVRVVRQRRHIRQPAARGCERKNHGRLEIHASGIVVALRRSCSPSPVLC